MGNFDQSDERIIDFGYLNTKIMLYDALLKVRGSTLLVNFLHFCHDDSAGP